MGKISHFCSQPKNSPFTQEGRIPQRDSICHKCGETGHWKRNCPQYLAELLKKKKHAASGVDGSGIFTIELNTFLNRSWIYDTGYGTHICNTTQGLRASRKLKSGDLACYLLAMATNNMVYFSAIPRDGIFEIDLSNSYANESSIYNVSNKRAKLDLDSALLWHCRLGHISKKRIEKLQHDELLNSTDLRAFEKCVPCMSGKMERKPYTHQVERAKDLLGLIHTDMSQTTLPKSFWDYALETAARILNMVPTKKVEKTPYEIVGRQVDFQEEDAWMELYTPIMLVLWRRAYPPKYPMVVMSKAKFATSFAEAEYIAAFDASKEAVWVRKFISGLANELEITIGARHIHGKSSLPYKVIEFGDINLEKVHTTDLADLFTKALAFPKNSELTRNIRMLPAKSRGFFVIDFRRYNHLQVAMDHHWRFEEINDMIKCKKVTAVEVAEELMKSDNVEVVLEGVVKFLKRKRIDEAKNSEINEAINDEDNGIREAKKVLSVPYVEDSRMRILPVFNTISCLRIKLLYTLINPSGSPFFNIIIIEDNCWKFMK
ncbi:zinc finger, CCHC-type containing protein [Tanacetum coccineum]